MRKRLIAVLMLAVSACHRAPQPITFDGALTDDKAALVRHGERLTHVLGCTGCHGAHLEGTYFTKDEPQYGPLYASNLTVVVPRFADAQLEGIIRHGTHPERKAVWVMPSQIFRNLSDADTRALMAYLRTLKPIGQKTPPPQFSAEDKKEIAEGLYKPAPQLVAIFAKKQPVDLGGTYALGRYIASTTCEECHGSDLGGNQDPMGKTPNLVVAGGYSRADFERLMTTGVPVGGRKLNPMMSGAAVTRFARLTPHERDALYAYLKARADRP